VETTTRLYTEHKVKVNGIRLHYVDWGNPHLPHLLLVHGMSGTAHYWDLVAPAFRESHHTVAVTLRGRLPSDYAPDGAYNTEDYMADIAALTRKLQMERFTFVGASLGGRIGLNYAATYPEQVERLVLVDIGAQVGGRPQPGRDRFADAPEEFVSLEEAEAFLRQFDLFAKLDQEAMRLVVECGFKQQRNGRWTWTYDKAIREQRRRAIAEGRPTFPDQWEVAARVRCPTLIIRGSRSDILTPEIARKTQEAIKGSRLVEIADSGHLPYLERREEFIRVLREFLAG
jgi:pimeloyl-ACP methyl ester carboxylesterase